jgi:hypothetical protein
MSRYGIELQAGLTWQTKCRGVRTAQALLFELVLEYVSPVAQVDLRT